MEKLLEIENLKTSFFSSIGEIYAVRGVDIDLYTGEAIGIVGESGSGKSVTMMSVINLLGNSGKIVDGSIRYKGEELSKLSNNEMEKLRGNNIAMIFQDPMTSLNPLFKVKTQLTEHLIKHTGCSQKEAYDASVEMLRLVGIPKPEERINQYPYQFSGGMRQRVMIALSLICKPDLIIADEPTTALDVTIQAQILDLLKKLKNETKTSIVLITHDLGVVADLCDRIYVVYGGMIVEAGTVEDIFYRSRHPYTWGLLDSIPDTTANINEKLKPIEGYPPDLFAPPKGCPFADRCKYAMKICKRKMPSMFEIAEGHNSRCYLNHKKAPTVERQGKGVI